MEMMWTAEIKILKNRVVFPVSKSPFCWKGSQFRLLWWSTTFLMISKKAQKLSKFVPDSWSLISVCANEKKIKGCLWLTCGLIILEMKTEITLFPRIIARGDYFLFRAKRGRLFEGRRLFPILFPGSRALKIYVFFFFQKKNLPKQTEDWAFQGFQI